MAGDGPRLVFGTYQSYDVLAADACRFGLTVADEAHTWPATPIRPAPALSGARCRQTGRST